jgi:hypothetical protein
MSNKVEESSQGDGGGFRSKSEHVVFERANYEQFATKLHKFGKTLTPEERALLMVVLDKGARSVQKADKDTVHSTSVVSSTTVAREFNLGQFIVEILLAIQGISAVVEEDGPSWIQEVTSTTK